MSDQPLFHFLDEPTGSEPVFVRFNLAEFRSHNNHYIDIVSLVMWFVLNNDLKGKPISKKEYNLRRDAVINAIRQDTSLPRPSTAAASAKVLIKQAIVDVRAAIVQHLGNDNAEKRQRSRNPFEDKHISYKLEGFDAKIYIDHPSY